MSWSHIYRLAGDYTLLGAPTISLLCRLNANHIWGFISHENGFNSNRYILQHLISVSPLTFSYFAFSDTYDSLYCFCILQRASDTGVYADNWINQKSVFSRRVTWIFCVSFTDNIELSNCIVEKSDPTAQQPAKLVEISTGKREECSHVTWGEISTLLNILDDVFESTWLNSYSTKFWKWIRKQC